MKLFPVAALALFAAAPAFAGTPFLVDFEAKWDNPATGANDNTYYSGGIGADGSTGPNYGVSFVGVSGLSNDAAFTFYLHAPSIEGVAYANDTAFMNVAGGVTNTLSFFYSSPSTVTRGVKAYSGLNLTGKLLGFMDLAANDGGGAATESGFYSTWTPVNFTFSGTAHSFDLTASANVAAFDNISAVPEPETFAMLLSGIGLMGLIARRRQRNNA